MAGLAGRAGVELAVHPTVLRQLTPVRQLGFADPVHFSRAFRARFGRTPSRWRARSNLEP
ncbi:MAG TPA: helix-turn-helix domain-containing protein [Amycolatopsis sp.]|uniref:helix-turn-helix domain-containing protein n=1 Tax=Amycolatopsis sp. TaxID=37632 RepID=UPI002B48CDD4|nr:helix-turn-helix domain-containing protein [Amycolatopsis sp.]HKS47997.1 helix-turn-helix domain-containing protein [Amycolatopsis sp.]